MSLASEVLCHTLRCDPVSMSVSVAVAKEYLQTDHEIGNASRQLSHMAAPAEVSSVCMNGCASGQGSIFFFICLKACMLGSS